MAVINKNNENTQFARTADENGNRTTPLDPLISGADNGTDPLADGHGRLIVRVALENGYVTEDNPFPVVVTETPSAAERLLFSPGIYIASEGYVLFEDPVLIYSISGFNKYGLDSYIQLFNLAVLPTDNVTIPDYSYYLPSGPCSLPAELMNESIYPTSFQNGLAIAFSSNHLIFNEIAGNPEGITVSVIYSLPS